MLVLGEALRERGHEVDLACASAPTQRDVGLEVEARARGFAPVLTFPAGRGFRWVADRGVAAALRRHVRRESPDVVHVWHTRDHTLALRALGIRARAGGAALVRSLASAGPAPREPWNRWILGAGCDGLICVGSESARDHAKFGKGRPSAGCLGAIDARGLRGDRDRGRAALGIAKDAPVVVVVARVQRHRRFDLLFDAMARLVRSHPEARLVVVGRGTHFDELARRPVESLGLSESVVLAGYRREDYADMLEAADVLTYLVPGSDGTCRALMEAAACGVPAVATRRGALAEIVRDGETGILLDEEPDALVSAWRALFDDRARLERLGAAARERAGRVFSPDRLAGEVEALYAGALGALGRR